MDRGSVTLLKILPELEQGKFWKAAVSPKLCHICVISSDDYSLLYTVVDKDETNPTLKLCWKSTVKANSVTFSEDGQQLLIVTETRGLQIYDLHNAVELIAEEDPVLLSEFAKIDLTDNTTVKIVIFNKVQLIVLIDSLWLVYFSLKYPEPLSIRTTLEIRSCLSITCSRELIYCLTSGGSIYAYSIENGKQAGILYIYSLLPAGSEHVEMFSCLGVSANGRFITVSDVTGSIYIASVYSYFNSADIPSERWDCGVSFVSASSGTSGTSVRTVSSLARVQPTPSIGDSMSVYMMELTEKNKTQKSTWDAYLDSLKQKKSMDNARGSHNSRSKSKRETGNSQLIHISNCPEGLNVCSLQVTTAGLAVWYTLSGSTLGGVYRLYNMSSGNCIGEQVLPDDTAVIPLGCMGLMDAFVSPSCLLLFLGNLPRDLLVNKLLHCVETDAIGRLLQEGEWGDLVIPLPTLADGLKQHQMDMARLALGLHSQAFKSSFIKKPNENEEEWQARIQTISSNMDGLFEIVYNALLENRHKLAFSEQLILLYLDHANDLLKFLHDSIKMDMVSPSSMDSTVVTKKKKSLIKQIMCHVIELRGHLRKQSKESFNSSEIIYQPLGGLDEDLKKEWTKWLTMDDRDVILQAVIGNNLPLLQTFLVTCRGWNIAEVMEKVRQEIFTKIENLIMKKEIEQPVHILVNLGCEPLDELRNLCTHTLNRSVRDNLAVYLSSKKILSPQELEAWNMLKMIEDILHLTSLPSIKFSGRSLMLPRGDLPQYVIPCTSEDYRKLSISTITDQSEEWRNMLLVELFFNTADPRLEKLIEPTSVWKFLLANNREDMLLPWINIFYGKFNGSEEPYEMDADLYGCETGGQNESLMKDLQRLFYQWDITPGMIDSISDVDCMTKTKDAVLDHLSRFGVLNCSDQKDPCTVLRRFCRTRTLRKMREILNQSSANMSFNHFEDMLLRFCIKYKLSNVMFPCFQYADFSCDQIENLFRNCETKEECWFKFWWSMKKLRDNFSDECIFQAVTETTFYLSDGSVDEYLNTHPLLVLATIMYSKKLIREVFERDELPDFPISRNCLQSTLKQLPLMEMAISSHGHLSRKQDVTLYQLLEGSLPFDISKLFAWQSMHTAKSEEIPHFASEKLSLKYGHNVTLSYFYYLKQWRPSFAVNMFVIDQLRQHKRISRRMKKQACNFAHGLALQNFTDQRKVCACVSFIEMLGTDSEIVRIHVTAGNKILEYMKSSVPDNFGKNKLTMEQVGMLMRGLIVSKEQTAEEMLSLLETALFHTYSLTIQNDSVIVKHLLHWEVAVKFAKLHHIKLPDQFLKHCARMNLWLQFVLFIQVYQYPVDQVMALVEEFQSSHLQEHLSHALSQKMAMKQESSDRRIRNKLKARDSRKTLYSKIGFRKEESSPDSSSGSPIQTGDNLPHISSSSSEDSFYQSGLSTSSDADTLTTDTYKDVFSTLLNCHRSPDPPRALLAACHTLQNPLFAIFATCYEPSSVLPCFCTWLMTSICNHISAHLKSELSSSLQQHSWPPQQVQFLMEEAVAVGYLKTLSRGIKIFFPENPLCTLLEFLVECALKKNFAESITKLKMFKASMVNMKNNPSLLDCGDSEGAFLSNGHWIALVAVCLLCTVLSVSFPSSYHQILFLRTLSENSFADNLSVKVPDFRLLAEIGECLSGSGVHADWTALCRFPTSPEYQLELRRCLEELAKLGKFQQALKFSTLVGLPKDTIIVAQLSSEFEVLQHSSNSHQDVGSSEFWHKCHSVFTESNVTPRAAASFFKEYSEKKLPHEERYHILKFALTWLREMRKCEVMEEESESGSYAEENRIELEMWNSLLQAEVELEGILTREFNDHDMKLFCTTRRELHDASQTLKYQNSTELTSSHQIERLNILIGKFLDQGDVYTACRLEILFNHQNQDLQLLLTCMSLAEGEITPYQLKAEHKLLLSEKKSVVNIGYKRRPLFSTRKTVNSSGLTTPDSSNSASSQSINMDFTDYSLREKQETLVVLEKLIENLQHGQKLGSRLVFCFCVALNLDKPFQEVLKLEEPFKLLQTSAADDCNNKWQVASDLMLAAQMNSEEVATMLCEEIISAIYSTYIPGEVNQFSGVSMWGCEMDPNFHRVIELCDEPSKLGKKLLTEAIKLGAINPEAYKGVVEILIRAHDCYTAALNMEGIAAVLHHAQTVTTNLLEKEEWASMVRLLTGIGRYTEMSYIFQILKENDQFEFLLGKNSGEMNDLKLALLDFLKIYYPDDDETFMLVCVHYSLYGEIANFKEKEGYDLIQNVLTSPIHTGSNSLTNIQKTKETLQFAMKEFSYAAENYLQAEKLTKALSVVHQAELIALQLSLLNTVPPGQRVDSLLQLKPSEVANLITQKLSYSQACIVARAYSHPVDWGAVLYQHCIVQGDTSYLPEFMQRVSLTSSLVEEVTKRYQLDSNITKEMIQHMKKFVFDVPDLELKYRIASRLGFRDILQTLINSPNTPYLKDMVYRSSYQRN